MTELHVLLSSPIDRKSLVAELWKDAIAADSGSTGKT